MFEKCLASQRSTVDRLRLMRKLLETAVEVNSRKMAGIQKHFDGAISVFLNKVQRYPNARLSTNPYGGGNLIAGFFILLGYESEPWQEVVLKPHEARPGQNAGRRQHPYHGNVVLRSYACH
jgi:hypothetical protein